MSTKPKLHKIRAGLYEIVGVRCGLTDRILTASTTADTTPCGGELRTEAVSRGEFKWQAFCRKCSTCDANGHPTLDAVLRSATLGGCDACTTPRARSPMGGRMNVQRIQMQRRIHMIDAGEWRGLPGDAHTIDVLCEVYSPNTIPIEYQSDFQETFVYIVRQSRADGCPIHRELAEAQALRHAVKMMAMDRRVA